MSISLSASNGHCNDPFSSRSALYHLKSSSRPCGPRRLIKNVAAGLAVEIHEYTGGAEALVAYNQDQISW